MSNEDQIIADGLSKVRLGIIKADWEFVCQGYNSISGEDLSVEQEPKPEPKSRLTNIRDMINIPTDEPPAVEEKPKVTVADLRKQIYTLIKSGKINADIGQIKKMKKADLLAIIEAQPEDDPDDIALIETSNDGISVLSAPVDEDERLRNQRLNAKKVRTPRGKRHTELENLFKTNKSLHDINRPPDSVLARGI